FRLETSQPRKNGPVKQQPEWVQLFAALTRKKRSNIQFQYRINLPWGMKGLDTRESLRLIVDSWSALTPILTALRPDGASYSRITAKRRSRRVRHARKT